MIWLPECGSYCSGSISSEERINSIFGRYGIVTISKMMQSTDIHNEKPASAAFAVTRISLVATVAVTISEKDK